MLTLSILSPTLSSDRLDRVPDGVSFVIALLTYFFVRLPVDRTHLNDVQFSGRNLRAWEPITSVLLGLEGPGYIAISYDKLFACCFAFIFVKARHHDIDGIRRILFLPTCCCWMNFGYSSGLNGHVQDMPLWADALPNPIGRTRILPSHLNACDRDGLVKSVSLTCQLPY